MEILGGITLFIILFIVLLLYSSFSWGYVASVIYEWFVLSQFTELPEIEWWQFAGIMFFVNCFIHSTDMGNFKKEVKDTTHEGVSVIVRPWLLLFAAWIFKIILY